MCFLCFESVIISHHIVLTCTCCCCCCCCYRCRCCCCCGDGPWPWLSLTSTHRSRNLPPSFLHSLGVSVPSAKPSEPEPHVSAVRTGRVRTFFLSLGREFTDADEQILKNIKNPILGLIGVSGPQSARWFWDTFLSSCVVSPVYIIHHWNFILHLLWLVIPYCSWNISTPEPHYV